MRLPSDQQLPDDLTFGRGAIIAAVLAACVAAAFLLPPVSSWVLNASVALVYLTIFFATLGRLSFPFWMSVGARAFFLGCAGVHGDLAYHSYTGIPMPIGEWHHQFFDLMQTFGGWTFVFGAAYYHTRVIDLRSRRERRMEQSIANSRAAARERQQTSAEEIKQEITELKEAVDTGDKENPIGRNVVKIAEGVEEIAHHVVEKKADEIVPSAVEEAVAEVVPEKVEEEVDKKIDGEAGEGDKP
jgi:hypothetical protein